MKLGRLYRINLTSGKYLTGVLQGKYYLDGKRHLEFLTPRHSRIIPQRHIVSSKLICSIEDLATWRIK